MEQGALDRGFSSWISFLSPIVLPRNPQELSTKLQCCTGSSAAFSRKPFVLQGCVTDDPSLFKLFWGQGFLLLVLGFFLLQIL